MFRKKPKPTQVDLTNEAYSRWLRAGRPQPIPWFLNLHPEEQEQCAILGDEHNQDLAVAVGYAIADPQLADASLDADDNPDSEDLILRRLADLAVAERAGAVAVSTEQPEFETMTMGGVSRREKTKVNTIQKAKDDGRSFLGKAPDPVFAKTPPMETNGKPLQEMSE